MKKLWVPSPGLFSLMWGLVWMPLIYVLPYDAASLVGGVIFFGWVAGMSIIIAVRRKRARAARGE